MLGYNNERSRNRGPVTARLDDLANLMPARLTALLIAAAAAMVPGARDAAALTTMTRNGGQHRSPNSRRPEAAMAGALGIRLGGPASHGGLRVEKPWIGEVVRAVSTDSAQRTLFRTAIVAGLGFLLAATVLPRID